MKILIAIAVLLNIYGVIAKAHLFKAPEDFQDHSHDNPHPRHKFPSRHHAHQHHHHHDNYVNELTVNDLADVLLSLPGSLGKQAYQLFLSLGEFLPADTKAHKFFTSIPKAIRRKTKGEISQLRTLPPAQSAANPIFMVQPAGYHMMPLPLHPMFSSSPYDYATRVPCRHTKLIHVPLHTFDVQISAISHRFKPVQNSYNESDDDDDDFGSDAGLKDLLDLISQDSDDEANPSDDSEIKSKPEKDVPETDTKEDGTPNENSDAPLPKESEEEPPKAAEEKSPDASNEKQPEVDDQKPKIQEESQIEENSAPPKSEDQPSPAENPSPAAEVVAPKDESEPSKEEIVPPKEEVAEPNEVVAEPKEGVAEPKEGVAEPKGQSEESAENPPATDNSDKKGKKKKSQPPKKGKKGALGPEPDLDEVTEPQPAELPAPAPKEEDSSIGEVTKPIPTKKNRRKKPKGKGE